MPHLIVHEPGRVPFSVPLREGLRVGRTEQNDLVLNDHQVSRQHISFATAAQGWVVTDLGSTHGTRVNGENVHERALDEGDRIQVGNVLLTFLEGEEPHEIHHHQTTIELPPQNDPTDQRLRLLYDASRAIGNIGDQEDLLGRMLEAVLDVFDCERALAGLCEEPGHGLHHVVRKRSSASREEVVVSRAVIEAMTVRREGIILRSADGGRAPRALTQVMASSAMGAPMIASSRVLGFLYVDDRRLPDRFSPRDLDFLTALAHLTAAALESSERYRRVAAIAEAREGPADEVLGASEPMRRLKTQIQKYGAASANVLIRGESGTGKELVARTLHAASRRAEQPLVTLNCAAIPESMIEAELFGYDKGAFTGAAREKRGKFVLADKGTLFLDEIGDLSLPAQAKVLRAVQEGEIQPLGSEKTLRVNVRILSATHKDLLVEIAEKRFREDLYYRLNVVDIVVPPLRERAGDVELLARALLSSIAAEMGMRLQGFTPAALDALRRHAWPGNVRELRNEIERAAINAESSIVDVSDLSPRILSPPRTAAKPPASLAQRFAELEPMERRLVEEALRETEGNVSEAARLLGITRIMMRRRMDRFKLHGVDE